MSFGRAITENTYYKTLGENDLYSTYINFYWKPDEDGIIKDKREWLAEHLKDGAEAIPELEVDEIVFLLFKMKDLLKLTYEKNVIDEDIKEVIQIYSSSANWRIPKGTTFYPFKRGEKNINSLISHINNFYASMRFLRGTGDEVFLRKIRNRYNSFKRRIKVSRSYKFKKL
jgi:hypothetical protein